MIVSSIALYIAVKLKLAVWIRQLSCLLFRIAKQLII